MRKPNDALGNYRRSLLNLNELVIFAVSVVFFLASVAPVRAQSQARDAAAISPVYEIVSIRPSAPNRDPNSGGTEELPGGYKATNVTLLTLIRRAYGIEMKNQISGAPGWLDSDAYDIQAKMDGSVADEMKKLIPSERGFARQQMLQALLADRFKLVVHRETRELPVYMLVVAKNGPKLQQSKLGGAGLETPRDSSLQLGRAGGKLIAQSITIRELAGQLTLIVSRTVLDKTGLAGNYGVTLQWTTDQAPMLNATGAGQRGIDAPPDTSAPSIFTAVQEQLGLKLEAGKGPVEVIVIDHVERPSGN